MVARIQISWVLKPSHSLPQFVWTYWQSPDTSENKSRYSFGHSLCKWMSILLRAQPDPPLTALCPQKVLSPLRYSHALKWHGISKTILERALFQGEKQTMPTVPCKLPPLPLSFSGAQSTQQKQGFHGRRVGEDSWMAGARRTVAALAVLHPSWSSLLCRQQSHISFCPLRPTGDDFWEAFAVSLWKCPQVTLIQSLSDHINWKSNNIHVHSIAKDVGKREATINYAASTYSDKCDKLRLCHVRKLWLYFTLVPAAMILWTSSK